MKRLTVILFSCLAGLTILHAAGKDEETQSDTKPDAGGVVIDPGEGQITPGAELTITFPGAMVAPDKIDMAGQSCPFVSQPPIEGDFLWKSQTEGVFVIKNVVAGAKHRLSLAPDLKDLSGKTVDAPGWSAEYTATPFTISAEFGEHEKLDAQPQVPLESSYKVRLTEVADHVYFQDRDSRQRFPVNVILRTEEKLGDQPETDSFRVEPREPLPMNRTYDLIVNGLQDAKSRQPLPYLKVVPVGKTAPLKVEWIAAYNTAYEKEPLIRIKFIDGIEPDEVTPDKITVEPAVPDMKLIADGDEIEVHGKFDVKQKYRVTVSPKLKGERGYGLPQPSKWGATFHAKPPTVLFPGSQIYMRSRSEVHFSFFEVNTPPMTWKIARIPLEKLPAVTYRVREFEKDAVDPVTRNSVIDPRTGFKKALQTELLVDAFKLPVVANGEVEAATGDIEVKRDIQYRLPAGQALDGPYLVEVSGSLGEGRIIGNRSILCTSDFILTQKRTPAGAVIRVAKMSDVQPVAGMTVRAVTNENIELARSVTDNNGMAFFERDKVFGARLGTVHLFIADTPNGPAMQFGEGESYPSGSGERVAISRKSHAEIITDRNLYRPGQVVKMKGLMREPADSGLAIPKWGEVHWTATESYGSRVAGEGTATLSADGGWEGEWTIPDKIKTGRYDIHCKIDRQDYEGVTQISVEEYRVPAFSVVVESEPEVGDAAHAHVSSAYFHGAPNAGARVHWKATWTAIAEFDSREDVYKRRYNSFAEVGPRMDPENEVIKTVEGDAKLDARGFADFVSDSPFKDDRAIGKASVSWRVEVTSLDGQTIVGGDSANVFAAPVLLGIRAQEKPGKDGGVDVEIDAINKEDAAVKDVPVHVDLFHVTTKTAKEQIAPFVFRYRNTDQFEKVASQEVKTPAEFVFPAKDTGRYVVAASTTSMKAPLVSDETTVTGAEPAELPVENETTFKIEHEKRSFAPGEKATLTVQSPFGGVAWVSVETDAILDTLLVPLTGNAGRIELPIKKEYAPNAMVAVYLVKPGGRTELPKERFAYSEIEVRRPDRELKIETHLTNESVKPGETVHGDLLVTSEFKPVNDVDLAVFAVDDAVLKLGDWKLPSVLENFYRHNYFAVRSYQSLKNYIEEIRLSSLTEKGFIIGGGGEDVVGNTTNVRKEFKTLAFWQGSLKTGKGGKAEFSFVAPDNLTTYRVVAVGQTKAHQFGGDATAIVKVSKPLLINTALPRFLRDGDDIELRAVIQQNFADSDEVKVRCVTDAGCKLVASDNASQKAAKDVPTVFRFKGHVQDVDLAPVKVRFEAVSKSNSKMSDAVEITIPVEPPTIIRKESVAGSFTGPQLNAQSKMPNDWKRGRGQFDTTVSTSPWLPKIAGLPMILEYPHGCFDQISSKLLGYSFLADLLAYLPDGSAREAEYRAVLEKGMKQFSDSLLNDGMLPYWPGGTTANSFVTCEAAWAVSESVRAGFTAPEGLQDKLNEALKKIANGRATSDAFERCLALFILTQDGVDDDFKSLSHDLYLKRNDATNEGRALLAIALHRQDIMAKEKEQLLKEIDVPIKERAFNPRNLSSVTREEALRAFAFDTVGPAFYVAQKKQGIRDAMLKLMDSSASLSTQENLWLLLAFKSMIAAEKAEAINTSVDPKGVASKNGRSVAWLDRNMSDPLVVNGLNKVAMTFLLRAEYSLPDLDTDRVDRGFRVERVVKNLTDAKRVASTDAPYKLGDQVLITYRIQTRKLQNYVALEDALPAGLEVVNPDLGQIGKFFDMPPSDPHDYVLDLSHSEMRDRGTFLYFDTFQPGSGVYSVLARATAAGTFRWPATQVVPMYDSRFSGLSPSGVCVISGE